MGELKLETVLVATLVRHCVRQYRGISLIRNIPFPGPFSGTLPRVLWWS